MTKLWNEFHNETPLIVIENCFLLVLAYNIKIVFAFFTVHEYNSNNKSFQVDHRHRICQHLITVRLRNAEGVPSENSQIHSLEQEIALAMILKSQGQSATQILKKLNRRFPHGAGRLDSYWLEDEAAAKLSVLDDFPDFSGVGDGSSGERGTY